MRLIEKAKYHYLLQKAVTTTYTKSNKETARRINCKGIKYTKEVNIPDNVQVNGTTNCFMTLTDHKRDSPSGGRVDWGGGESRKIGLSPHAPICFDQKYQFCNFHAVFGHFAQIVPPPVNLIWETLQKINF